MSAYPYCRGALSVCYGVVTSSLARSIEVQYGRVIDAAEQHSCHCFSTRLRLNLIVGDYKCNLPWFLQRSAVRDMMF